MNDFITPGVSLTIFVIMVQKFLRVLFIADHIAVTSDIDLHTCMQLLVVACFVTKPLYESSTISFVNNTNLKVRMLRCWKKRGGSKIHHWPVILILGT